MEENTQPNYNATSETPPANPAPILSPTQSSPVLQPKNKQWLLIIIVCAIFLILMIGGMFFTIYSPWFVFTPPTLKKVTNNTQPVNQTENWRIYQSAPGGFTVKYPNTGWDVIPNDISGVTYFNIIPLPGINYIETVSFKRQNVSMPTPNDLMYISIWKTNYQSAKTTLESTLSSMSSAPGFSGGSINPIDLDGKNGIKLSYGFSGTNNTNTITSELVGVDWNDQTYIIAGGKTPEFDSFLASFKFTPALSQIIGIPTPSPYPCSDGIESWKIGDLCSDGGSWTSGSYTCTDGTSGKVSNPTCTTAQNLRNKAVAICGNSPKSCPIPTPIPTIGPNLDTYLQFLAPKGWSNPQSDSVQITLQSPDYNYSNYAGGGTQQGEEITITRTPNIAGATLDSYNNGPFKSFAKTSHDGLPAFVGIVSYAGLPYAPNNLMYNYIIIKKGYIWTISYIVYSPDPKKGVEYQQKFNSFLDTLHLN